MLQAAGRNRDQQREALAALVQAYQLDPACDATLLHTIAQTGFVLRDWPLVESATALLLGRDAEDANALVWRAAAVQQRNDFDEAERLLREAVRVVPGNPVALHKLALCIKEQARFAEAETLLRRVLELSPNNAHAMFDLSELEIRSGRYADGWAHYESRIVFGDDLNDAHRALAEISSYWQGESLAGKTLVVYGEQGNGDCLWAVRFLPLLAERARREGGRVIFGHDGPLRHLFERMLPADVALETGLANTAGLSLRPHECAAAARRLRFGRLGPCVSERRPGACRGVANPHRTNSDGRWTQSRPGVERQPAAHSRCTPFGAGRPARTAPDRTGHYLLCVVAGAFCNGRTMARAWHRDCRPHASISRPGSTMWLRCS